MTQNAQPKLALTRLRDFLIPIPPAAEQRKIAAILGTWDAAIATVEQLIAALQARKQGLMQRLLTGAVRFPEFVTSHEKHEYFGLGNLPSDWPVQRLEEHLYQEKEWITIRDDRQYNRCTVKLHNLGVTPRDSVYGREVATKRQQLTKEGDLIVAEIDAKVGGFGIVKADTVGSIVSSHYYLFKVESLDLDFLEQCIFNGMLQHQVDAVGSTNYAAIRAKDVLGYKLPIPTMPEQRKIGACLASLDRLIQKHQQHAVLLRKQKQSLMQQLLTGQVRVNVRDEPQYNSSVTTPLINLQEHSVSLHGE